MPILIKVGRAHSCDLKYTNPTVSSLHAEITVRDDGSISIEDKESTNGTFVGSERLEPNRPVDVQRGDHVRFGTEVLNWNAVPYPKRSDKYRHVYGIGSNFANKLVINDPFVSRFHAELRVGKDNKAYICDLKSRNGTMVNGVKIQPDTDVRIKRKDSVILGNKEISSELEPLIPDNKRLLKIVAACLGSVFLVACVVFGIMKFTGSGADDGSPKGMPDFKIVREAVTYVTAQYQLTAKIEDNPINNDIWLAIVSEAFPDDKNPVPGELPVGKPQSYCATAFFVDSIGHLGTNRHVATPWDIKYLPTDQQQEVKTAVDQFVDNQQLPVFITSKEILNYYNTLSAVNPNHILYRMIYNQTIREYQKGNLKSGEVVDYMNSLIHQFKKSNVSVSGKMVSISIGYAGRNYTHQDEYDRCTVVAVYPDSEVDLALLQLNTKKTPENVKFVFSPSDYYTGQLQPQKDELIWIGYPYGNFWNLDSKTFSLEPQIRETRVTKLPSKYNFEFQGEPLGGASGSPIINKETGQLVGVIWGGNIGGATYGQAVLAKYLKRLYDEEVN